MFPRNTFVFSTRSNVYFQYPERVCIFSTLACVFSVPGARVYFQYPERVYTTQFGVTALDFSVANPNLLAVSGVITSF